jgi:hypothetical protein
MQPKGQLPWLPSSLQDEPMVLLGQPHDPLLQLWTSPWTSGLALCFDIRWSFASFRSAFGETPALRCQLSILNGLDKRAAEHYCPRLIF